ncbi:hypothetical protein [Sciscionella marina]|uniref:hypothetical protein n=1 Tax=Sciscionella marina TaxID=508770 RepID=UPI0003AA7496|nr:hypothetical protein [Sciscionella marina]
MSNPHSRAEQAPPAASAGSRPWALLSMSGVAVATLCAAVAGLVGNSDEPGKNVAAVQPGTQQDDAHQRFQSPNGQATQGMTAPATTTKRAPDGSMVVVAMHPNPDGTVTTVTTRTAPDGSTTTSTNQPGSPDNPGRPGGNRPAPPPWTPPTSQPTQPTSRPTTDPPSSPTWTASPIPTHTTPPTSETSSPPTHTSTSDPGGSASTLPEN